MRRRIWWLMAATTSAVVLAFIIPLLLLVQTLAQDRAISSAAQQAHSAATMVSLIADEPRLDQLLSDQNAASTAKTSVVTPSGVVLGKKIAADDPDVIRGREGADYSQVRPDGGHVVIPVNVPNRGLYVIVTRVEAGDMRQGVVSAWIILIVAALGLTALALGAAAWQGRRVSEPLKDVAQVARRLRNGDLQARAQVVGTSETVELAVALNGLADRIIELLAAERAAVGDLAHRLRTPVTALRLDAEAVKDPELGERLQGHVLNVQRTIDAIVREARHSVRDDMGAASDATAIVDRRIAYWEPLAEDQGRELTIDLPGYPILIVLADDDFTDVVDVLIDNVFAHTPEGVDFSVRLLDQGSVVVLEVADEGPGFPTVEAPPRIGSSGLGLGIVTRTIESAGGTVERSEPGEPHAWTRLAIPVRQR